MTYDPADKFTQTDDGIVVVSRAPEPRHLMTVDQFRVVCMKRLGELADLPPSLEVEQEKERLMVYLNTLETKETL